MYPKGKNITASDLLHSWISTGLVPISQKQQIKTFIVSQQQEKKLSLFLEILIAIGAFITSSFFLGFFYISKIIYYPSELFWGIIFIGLALILAKISRNRLNMIKYSFAMQASLFTMMMGKFVFMIGFAKSIGMPWNSTPYGITLAAFLITITIYYFYPIALDRFLSTLVLMLLLLICILLRPFLGLSTNVLLNLFFCIQFFIAGTLFLFEQTKKDYVPIAYALSCSLCLILTKAYSIIGHKAENLNLTFFNWVLTLALIALIAWISDNFKKLGSEGCLVALFGAILLGIISVPGIILSICLIIFGHAKHKKLLFLLGVAFMPLFIFLFYYNLNVSLLVKSGILIGTGLILLAIRAYLHIRKLDQT